MLEMHSAKKILNDCLSEIAADPLVAAILVATSVMVAIVLLSQFAI
jgi:hypothetical protein